MRPFGLVPLGLLLSVLSCSSDSNPTGPLRPPFYAFAELDSYAADGRVDLYWTIATDPPDFFIQSPAPPVAKVSIFLSRSGPDRAYIHMLDRGAAKVDSATIGQLANGAPCWFKIAAFDSVGWPIVVSKPVMTIPGLRNGPSQSVPITPQDFLSGAPLSWAPSSDSILYAEQLDSETSEARVVDLATMSVQPFGPGGPPNGIIFDLEWGPGGDQIAYTKTPSRTIASIDYRIWIATRGDGSVRPISVGPVDFCPAWADTHRLYYCRGTYNPPNISEVWRMDLDGEPTLRAVTDNQSLHKYNLSVRPSDELIVFEGLGQTHSLYTLRPGAGSIMPLTHESWCVDSSHAGRPMGST